MKIRESVTNISNSWKKIAIGEIVFWALLFIMYAVIDYSVDYSKGEFFVFRKPSMLFFLLGIIPLHVLFLRKAQHIASFNLGGSKSIYRPNFSKIKWLQHLLFTRVIVFILLALAQPSIGKEKVEGTIKSLELVVCLDVSNSMNVRDMDGNESRLTASKRSMNDLINRLSGEKIGVCVFAGASLVQLPLTNDYEAAKLFIEEVSTDLISRQGTNITSALETAKKMFSPVKGGKAILLITDGEDHDGKAVESVISLAKNTIELHTLGVGSRKGGPLLVDAKRPELGYRKSESGQILISKVDPQLIEKLANTAGGSFLLSSSAYPSVEQLLTEINQIKRTNLRDLAFEVRSNNYRIPVGTALLCFITSILLSFMEQKNLTE
jgi:Ca-activated chloride channel family protein